MSNIAVSNYLFQQPAKKNNKNTEVEIYNSMYVLKIMPMNEFVKR